MPRPVCPSHGEERSERTRSRAGSPSSPIADLHAASRDPRRLPHGLGGGGDARGADTGAVDEAGEDTSNTATSEDQIQRLRVHVQ